MKKILAYAVLAAMLTSMTGCGMTEGSDTETIKKPEPVTMASAETTVTTEPETEEVTTTSTTVTTTTTTVKTTTTTAADTTSSTGTSTTASEKTTAAPSADDGWKDAYKEVLTAYDKEHGKDNPEIAWDLQDLDNDGTPELLISEGMFHVAGVLYYYYDNGKVKTVLDENGEQLHYGVYGGVMVCPEEHLLCLGDIHMGYTYSNMCKYEDHKLTKLLSLSENSGAVLDGDVTYTVNDETVTKEKYDEALKELNSKNWENAGMKHKFSDLSVLD